MLPSLVALACALFVVYLFFTDLRQPKTASAALWVPLIWMFLCGSRSASSWLNLRPSFDSALDYSEGSPIDRAVFLTLIIAGILILARRNIDWSRLIVRHHWIVLYFLYCLASASWAEEPGLAVKRLLKELGNPIMVLVILTEREPYAAVGAILRRLAFLTLPLSVLFIKYYPDLGRWYRFDGAETFTGVATQKNGLGMICLTAGIYMTWALLWQWDQKSAAYLRQNRFVALVLAGMVAWLLYKSNSQTSLVCLLVAMTLLSVGRMKLMARRPGLVLSALLFTAITIGSLEAALGIKDYVLTLLGREPDLTDRTNIWAALLAFDVNPVVGTGFMSFWTGPRLEEAWQTLGVRIGQAHNGYLEQYLNLGYIGVGFIILILGSGLAKACSHWKVYPAAGILRLCFIVVAMLYNWTEAAFYGTNNMWTLLLLACIDVPQQKRAQRAQAGKLAGRLDYGEASLGLQSRIRPAQFADDLRRRRENTTPG